MLNPDLTDNSVLVSNELNGVDLYKRKFKRIDNDLILTLAKEPINVKILDPLVLLHMHLSFYQNLIHEKKKKKKNFVTDDQFGFRRKPSTNK